MSCMRYSLMSCLSSGSRSLRGHAVACLAPRPGLPPPRSSILYMTITITITTICYIMPSRLVASGCGPGRRRSLGAGRGGEQGAGPGTCLLYCLILYHTLSYMSYIMYYNTSDCYTYICICIYIYIYICIPGRSVRGPLSGLALSAVLVSRGPKIMPAGNVRT